MTTHSRCIYLICRGSYGRKKLDMNIHSFDNRILKFKSSEREALEEHKLFCGAHKPIFLEMQPFVIYADFEALLVKTDEVKGGNTKIVHKHEATSYGFLVKARDDVPTELIEESEIPTVPVVYRGGEQRADVAKRFVEAVVEVSWKIEKLMKTNIPLTMTKKKHIKSVILSGEKLRDHNHLTGKFRQILCSKCNLELQQTKFVPVFFHNLSNYDSHFIITELGFDTPSISVIPNSEEKFISFTKHISSKFTIRFIDTFRFMALSLSSLVENLITHNFENFRETAKHFVSEDMLLVTRKGVYPYDRGLNRKILSTRSWSGTTSSARRWANAAHYYTAPGLSFDAMPNIRTLSDYDMLLIFENGIRGGNNLYGYAISEYMPYGFNWVAPKLDGLIELAPKSARGRVLEVDISYPQHLYDKHNDLPFLPQNSIPPGSKVRKLMAMFSCKDNYIVHYRNLQQAIDNGLIVEKIHRVLEFSQSDWLAKYI
ncbi:Uncharacterized protein FWK35_00011968 [Aphis craccivora]|uniref:DNA-directed DNA polymerase n=1 Tax=Aphis craccivora TaxID=307492 RepID=A0A6G0YAF9_APHCR|nr:Uncharacterized protein FWK35_00011968 [Aphis craccivora]